MAGLNPPSEFCVREFVQDHDTLTGGVVSVRNWESVKCRWELDAQTEGFIRIKCETCGQTRIL